jgi:hypothetical protein
LDTLLNDGDGVRCQVVGHVDATDEKVFVFGPNRSGYRGTSYRLTSRVLGVYPTGVKRGPTVKQTYHNVNAGEVRVRLVSRKVETPTRMG